MRKATDAEKAIARALPTAVCTKCRTEKPRSGFYRDQKKTNGLCSICLACRAADSGLRYHQSGRGDVIKAKKKADRKNNPVAALARDAKYRAAGRETRNAKMRGRKPDQRVKPAGWTRKWRLENPQKVRSRAKMYGPIWRKNNPRKYKLQAIRAYTKRRALKLAAMRDNVTLIDIIERDGPSCYICGRDTDPSARPNTDLKSELEHVVALSAGGLHSFDNCRVSCHRCNRIKGRSRTPEETRRIVYMAITRPTHAAVLVGT